jgi:hypothetical protein
MFSNSAKPCGKSCANIAGVIGTITPSTGNSGILIGSLGIAVIVSQ